MREKAREHETGRLAMREAFVQLLFLAQRSADIPDEETSRLQHLFWDGNVAVKEAFAVTYLLAAAWQPHED